MTKARPGTRLKTMVFEKRRRPILGALGLIAALAGGGGGAQVPPALVAQLKPGGRMVIPAGGEAEVQFLQVMVKRADGSISTQRSLPVRFVPLTRSN